METAELIAKTANRRGLSPRTIKTYQYAVERFFRFIGKEPKYVTKKNVEEFIDGMIARQASRNTLNICINALKFFFKEVLGRNVAVGIRFSKKPKRLPEVLTKEEILRMFAAIENPQHRLMAELLYSAGLRLGELLALHVKDLEFGHNYGWVRAGKGNKDRMFIIAERLKPRILEHIQLNALQHDALLFSGRHSAYHQRTVQEILRKAAKKACIMKNVHPHTLRHSYATHLIENGADLQSVQSLLGHANISTTMAYIHTAASRLSAVPSPYDNLPFSC